MSGGETLYAGLVYCGFSVRRWKGERLYLCGYGRDISAYLDLRAHGLDPAGGPAPADGTPLIVSSSWRAARYNGLRCKGVKHEILSDLYRTGLVSRPPPDHWQDVPLDGPLTERPVLRRYAEKPAALAAACTRPATVSAWDDLPPLESRPVPDALPVVDQTSTWPARRGRDPYAPLRALHESGRRR